MTRNKEEIKRGARWVKMKLLTNSGGRCTALLWGEGEPGGGANNFVSSSAC